MRSFDMQDTSHSISIPKPCQHLSNFKHRHGLNSYTLLQNLLRANPNPNISKVSFHVIEAEGGGPTCRLCCGFYICLICSTISCSSSSHSLDNNGHDIAVDLYRAELFCFACSDQVYDVDFDNFVMSQLLNKDITTIHSKVKSIKARSSCSLELKSKTGVVLSRDKRSKMVYPLGLRGFNNLGSTCFMNSVLQALIHAPPLMNYFLSDRHRLRFCRKRSAPDQLCLPCDITHLFSAVFSNDRTPYTPARFLYSWWMHSENHASYEQQDAHEFFMSILDQIHEKESKNMNMKPSKGFEDCECIAHKVFSGLLQSDVTCTTCGSVSTTYDPFVDISLDLDIQIQSNPPKNKAQLSALSNGNIHMSTLSSCLQNFTRSEKLGSNQKLFCENCQQRRESLKQMSFKQLPLVLCLHIKRFEHSHIRKMSRKIDQYLQFSFCLDMSPYLSSTIVRNRHGNRLVSLEDDDDSGTATKYEIFAVVTHTGILESGHYITYLRLHNQWYRCDDAWIMEVDEDIVRASQCYMIYYQQKTHHHKSSDDVSCSPLSPRTDAILPIVGCC